MTGTPTHFERDDFLENIWDYRAGQHVALIGPTQRAGKTTFAFQLLEHTPSWIPAEVLVMKPRDRVVSANAARLGLRETPVWPPHKKLGDYLSWSGEQPNRYVVWPRHSMDPQRDNEHMYDVFRSAILHRYREGDGITFADELYGLSVELGLYTETESMLTRGGGMGAGLWYATQKPSGTNRGGISTFAYNSPTWMFLARDPDKRNRERFGEMEVGDPKKIEEWVMGLPKFHWLCINRDGPYFCTVGA
jgi:hypothetical protein